MNIIALDDSAPIAAQSQKRYYGLIALGLGLAFFLLSTLLAYFGSTLFDDAYMFIRYADNLLDGHGLVWNQGEDPVYGTTSLLYAFTVAASRAIFSAFELSSSVTLTSTASFFALAAIVCLSHIRSHLFKQGAFVQSLNIYFWSLVCLTPLLIHGFFGMDTTLSLLTHCLLIYAVLKCIQSEQTIGFIHLLLVILTAFITFAARPDNLVYAGLFPILALYFFAERPIKKILLFGIGLTILVGLDALLKYWLLGDPLPLSSFAKRNGFYEGYTGYHKWNPIGYLLSFVACSLPFLVFSRFKKDWITVKLAITFFAPMLITFTYHVNMVQIMGHMGRFHFPFLAYVIVFGIICRLRVEKPRDNVYRLRRFGLLVIGYLLLFTANETIAPLHTEHMKAAQEAGRISPKTHYQYPAKDKVALPTINAWKLMLKVGEFGARLPKGSVIAMSEYGYIGSRAPNIKIVDPIGLHNPNVAHSGFDAEKFFAEKPDVIAMPDDVYTRINAQILDHPSFQQDYDYYATAFLCGIALNKKSPHYEKIQTLFNQLWKDVYGNVDKRDYLASPLQQNNE